MKFNSAIDMAYIRENDALSDFFNFYWYPTTGVQVVSEDEQEVFKVEPKLVVAEFNRIFFEIDLEIAYIVEGILVAEVNPAFNKTKIYLTDPEVTSIVTTKA